MADRVIVLFEGRVAGEFDAPRPTRTRSCAPRPASSGEEARVSAGGRRRSRGRQRARAAPAWPRRSSASASSGSCSRWSSWSARRRSTTTASSARRACSSCSRAPRSSALLAIGETLVIVTRNVDLSVGSVLGLSAYTAGDIFVAPPARSRSPLVILAGAGVGLVCGVVNGAIVTLCRVPSLVVTLGTLYVIRGIDASWAGGNQVDAFSLPDASTRSATARSSASRTSASSRSSASPSRPTRCGRSARAATSTRSARTPRRPRSPASPSSAASSRAFALSGADRRLRRRALALATSARSTRPPARATSSR